MADSFFGFDTSSSNINDDEGGGGPSEDEYDALNDETFGQDSEGFDWEVEHEHLAEQLESSRRHNASVEDHVHSLEASLSQLVVDETDAPQSRTLGSSVWRHDAPFVAPTPVPTLKNVCTVEELERQLRQKQQQQQSFPQGYNFPPRFPPVILQRPPGLQAPVPLPFAPQQTMSHSQMTLNQMSQPLNSMLTNNQMSQTNLMNQMGQNLNQMNQMGQSMNQSVNQFMQNSNQMGSFQNNQMGNSMMNLSQNMQHQMGQSNQMIGQNVNQMGQNLNQMPQNMNQIGQNVNQMGQNVNQMGQNVNQMIPNGNQFNHGMNQFQMMSQQRMMAPPPGMNMPPRQNFSPSMGQYNQPFRGPAMPTKLNDQQQMNPQNMLINQQMQQNIPTSVSQKSSNQQINQMNHNMNHMNHGTQLSQSPQNKQQNQNQKIGNQIQNQVDPKMQKTRTYNNSSQKNLTSQNLVQLIQNTHPMLQFNNSFHNASHHPMLNNRNNMFNNNNNQFNPLFNNQRHNGTYSNSNSMSPRQLNGDECSVSSDTDEYAGLMTPREKQWLINIQMLQLNTGTPYIHDFYYTVFLERQKEKETVKEAHKANQQNHPFYSGGVKQETTRERHNSARHNSCSEDGATPRAYVPQQFENSLGKLQCGSVTAPRKIIDVELVASEPARTRAPSAASVTTPAEVPREMRRTKQLLLDIEALYLILLRLEELNDPLAISNALILKEREEKQKLADAALAEAGAASDSDCNVFLRNIESVQRRAKHECGRQEDKRQVVNLAVNQKPAPIKNLLDEDKDDLINKMFLGLLQSDRIVQMMSVRKGRALISRFVSRVPPSHARLRALWSRVLRALPHAARRDLPPLPPAAHHRYAAYIQNANGWQPVLESCSLLAEALDPARTPYALTMPFTLSCVCALIEKASQLTNTPEATSNERQWFKFLKTVARALKNTTLSVAKPIKPLSETKLLFHIKQLESRSTIEILQRGKTATEFADISKTDVSEQLVKHLC